jgi:hypothetical protein
VPLLYLQHTFPDPDHEHLCHIVFVNTSSVGPDHEQLCHVIFTATPFSSLVSNVLLKN